MERHFAYAEADVVSGEEAFQFFRSERSRNHAARLAVLREIAAMLLGYARGESPPDEVAEALSRISKAEPLPNLYEECTALAATVQLRLSGQFEAKGQMREGATALESDLLIDPSRADLWVSAAKLHLNLGENRRACQLLVRTCASRFIERQEAQEVLRRYIDKLYQISG